MTITSCKKDYTCVCTTTDSSSSTNVNGTVTTSNQEPSTKTVTYKKVKKSQLRILCSDGKRTASATNTGGGSTTSYSRTTETKCEIK